MRRLIATGFICTIATMCVCTLLTIRALDSIADTLDKDEPKQTITYEQVNQADEMSYMTYDELMQFDKMMYNLYLEEYCTNYCEDCDTYYYKECMCNACSDNCQDCYMYDYEFYFIIDCYDMIMDQYEEVLSGIIERRNNPQVEVVPSYF